MAKFSYCKDFSFVLVSFTPHLTLIIMATKFIHFELIGNVILKLIISFTCRFFKIYSESYLGNSKIEIKLQRKYWI
jgi:hypothetical protein